MDGSYSVVEIENWGAPLKLAKRNFREPEAGEVLIKVLAATVNPSDLSFLRGGYGKVKPNQFPLVPGFEGCGEITKVGQGVEGNIIGKRASFVANPAKLGNFNGAWAEYIYVSRYSIIIYDSESIAPEKICSAFINPLTVLGFIDTIQKSNVSAIIQNGASGGLGKMLIRICSQHKIKTINLVRKEEQLEELKKIGADYVINSSNQDWQDQLRVLAEQNNALAAFECVGGDTTSKILDAMPDGSTVYNYGNLEAKPLNNFSTADFIFREKTLKGWWLSTWMRKLKPEELVKWVGYVKADLEGGANIFETEYRKDSFSLSNVADAIEAYRSNMSLGKVLIKPNII